MSARKKAKQPKPPRRPLSKKRLWLFRLMAACLPLLALMVLEGALRIANYGYPADFFVPARIDGRDFFVTNDRFGFRFFPPTIARTPFALRMAAEKPTNTFRIFLFGESAAQGDPDPTFGVGRYLEVLLRNRYPGMNFEVVCVAMTAINSHAILPIARECARRNGDLWVIYMGNNEIVGPYGAGTVFGPKAPPLALIRASLAVKATKIGQLSDKLIGRFKSKNSGQKSWGGMSMFKEHQLRADDPARLQAYKNFGGNLEDILRAGHNAGVPVVLSTVGSNLKDCAPFASLHKQGLDGQQKTRWEQNFNSGVEFENQNQFAAAIEAYSKAEAIDPEFAELHFRKGTCELALGNTPSALREFEMARDFDALGFRADGPINDIIARAAKRHASEGVYFVDAAGALETNSPDGITGEELFYEHVHLNFAGNYLLAKLLADKIVPQLPKDIVSNGNDQWASAETCDRRLAVSLWDRHRVWQVNFSRVSEAPFTEQLNDVPRARRYMRRLEEFRSQMNEAAQQDARTMYEEAVKMRPDDPSLHGNFAQLLGEFGDLDAAVTEQERVCELLPLSHAAFYKVGLLRVRQNKMEEAAREFRHAVALRADYVPALNELGLILANQQKSPEAEKLFMDAIKINPGYAESYINFGFTKQGSGSLSDALVQYELAASLQPEGPAAHFNRAVGLAAEHRSAEAVKSFEAAVWMNPTFWQARYLMGVELALAERVAEAQAQFQEVVRLRPDFAKAHLNLGVSLAKQRKLDEALAEFQQVLTLSPTNEQARRSIEAIHTLKSRLQ